MTAERINRARRRLVVGAAWSLSAASWAVSDLSKAEPALVNAHGGPILPPVLVPDFGVRLADGKRARSTAVLRGKVTALQLIFTGCSTTCPMQGAIFQRVQALLERPVRQDLQLISVSIDPQDSPSALRYWLAKFKARPGWHAGTVDIDDLPLLQRFFGTSGDSLASHATQVQIIDRHGALVWRTNELPAPESVCNLMHRV